MSRMKHPFAANRWEMPSVQLGNLVLDNTADTVNSEHVSDSEVITSETVVCC